tara:strand:+ start:42 stop:881 length:840 start_codon:yes stop_codon:yes gene_type:complete
MVVERVTKIQTQSDFSDTGFLIVKDAISKNFLLDIQLAIYNLLNNSEEQNMSEGEIYSNFCQKVSCLKTSEYEFTKPIYDFLLYKEYLSKILLEEKLYSALTNLLGKDLSFCTDPSITLNLPNKDSPEKNYLFKDWHQEIWSGAGTSSVQIWTPILHENSKEGQMAIILESHKWGHIPHRNRKPIDLPENYETAELNLEYGDVIIFSTLLMHRSRPTNSPRLSLPVQLDNFRYNYVSNNRSTRNWKIFSYSEVTKIEKMLGNHYLSPYRTCESDVKFET